MLLPLSPDTAANIFPEESGTIETLDATTDGFWMLLAASNVSVYDPSFVVRRAVRR
jgi:hypothetical protein